MGNKIKKASTSTTTLKIDKDKAFNSSLPRMDHDRFASVPKGTNNTVTANKIRKTTPTQ